MDLFRKISETVSKGVSTATEKAQQTVEITRLNSQISSKRKEIEKLYGDIGAAVFNGYLNKDLSLAEPKVIPACEQIAAIRHEIDTLEDRIMMIRNEKECVCGKKVPFDTRFCPSCGHRFPEPSAQAERNAANPEPDQTADADTTDITGNMQEPEPAAASDWSDVGRALPVYRMEEEPFPGERAQDIADACPACGTTVEAGARYCPSCGTPVSS
ncbi:zinc ribbon domain-containing protein [Cohnella pontilimi]|nr:zinc ribbon domain-containing protein [Cohnella pontilimi]